MQIAHFVRVRPINVMQAAFEECAKRVHWRSEPAVTHCTIMFYIGTRASRAAHRDCGHLRPSLFAVL